MSTVAGNGKGATRFGPKGPATTGAVRERARRGTLKYKEGSSGALPGQGTEERNPEARKQRELTTRAKELGIRKNAAKLVYRGNYAPSRGDRHGGEKTTDASGRPA